MAIRVNTAEIKEIMDTTIEDMTPFITVANLLVEQYLASSNLSAQHLKEIERWLSAHFAAIMDPRVRKRTIGDGAESYAISGGYKGGLDATPYGQQAMVLDTTGKLAANLAKRPVIIEAIVEDYA